MPELPEQIKQKLLKNPNLSHEDIHFLLSSPATYHFFCAVKEQSIADEKTMINWLKGSYSAFLNDKNLDFDNPPISATALANLLDELMKKNISSNIAKQIFSRLCQGETDVQKIIEREGFMSLKDDKDLKELIENLIQNHPQQAMEYRAGKEKLLGFFVGQIMKETKGLANPEDLNRLLKELLNK